MVSHRSFLPSRLPLPLGWILKLYKVPLEIFTSTLITLANLYELSLWLSYLPPCLAFTNAPTSQLSLSLDLPFLFPSLFSSIPLAFTFFFSSSYLSTPTSLLHQLFLRTFSTPFQLSPFLRPDFFDIFSFFFVWMFEFWFLRVSNFFWLGFLSAVCLMAFFLYVQWLVCLIRCLLLAYSDLKLPLILTYQTTLCLCA